MALSEPLCKTTVPSNHSPPSELGWLKYALASFFFGAVGQFSMGFLSEDLTSRFIISLGDLTFVIFFGFLKFLYFKYKNKRWAKISDCAWFDSNGAFKKGTFKYLLLCITTRFIYGFAIILAYAEAKDHDMNLGIVLSIRSSEALFVALWTYILLKEKLSHCKLLGLFILIGGIVGLSMPKDTEDGFSVLAVIYALVAALVSSFRNFSVKRLAKLDVDGDTIILHAVFWADLITVILGCILCFWGIGFNHEFYDTYFDQESIEFTWTRFGMATFVGFAIFFSLTTTANANQKGYAGIFLFYFSNINLFK